MSSIRLGVWFIKRPAPAGLTEQVEFIHRKRDMAAHLQPEE
jgi:hypothetical protein